MDRAVAQEQPGGRRADRRGTAPGAARAPEPGTPGPDRLALRIPGQVEQLRPLRRRIEGWARALGLTEDVLIDLQLAVGEAVSNAMEHAYTEERPGTVDVELEVRPSARGRELVARVVDRGRWKPASSRPSYRGRGIAMIDDLSDGMRVTNNTRGTEVAFTVPLDVPRDGDAPPAG